MLLPSTCTHQPTSWYAHNVRALLETHQSPLNPCTRCRGRGEYVVFGMLCGHGISCTNPNDAAIVPCTQGCPLLFANGTPVNPTCPRENSWYANLIEELEDAHKNPLSNCPVCFGHGEITKPGYFCKNGVGCNNPADASIEVCPKGCPKRLIDGTIVEN